MIVFYVSGHGYGHATRTGAVMANIRRAAPDIPVAVRTEAPRWAFPRDITYCPAQVDFTIVEQPDALSLDVERTRASVQTFCAALSDILRNEVAWLQDQDAQLLVADIPFLPGLLSRETSIPAIALGNFTWHWILEPVMPQDTALAVIAESYSHFAAAFRMPLSPADGWSEFPACIDVPLVTPLRSERSRLEIRRCLGLPSDDRPTVLVAGRAQLSADTLASAAAVSPEFDFLVKAESVDIQLSNVYRYSEAEVSFSDALRASSVVLSKLGYSTAAECIAEEKRLLYPARSDFRENEVLPHAAARYIPVRQVQKDLFIAGDWKSDLSEIVGQDFPSNVQLDVSGAAVCAGLLLQYV